MFRVLKRVWICWPMLETRLVALAVILGLYSIFCVGLGTGDKAVTFFGFRLEYLHSVNPLRTIRTAFQECFSLAWLVIWVTVAHMSLQRMSRFFSPASQLWLRMRGVSIFDQTVTALAWSVWLSSVAALGSACGLLYICRHFGFPLLLAWEHAAALFGALLFGHLCCLLFYSHGRMTNAARQQVVLLALSLPLLLIILGAAVFQEGFGKNIAVLPAAAPYLYAVPGLDFKELVLSTSLWSVGLAALVLASSALRAELFFSTVSESVSLITKGVMK